MPSTFPDREKKQGKSIRSAEWIGISCCSHTANSLTQNSLLELPCLRMVKTLVCFPLPIPFWRISPRSGCKAWKLFPGRFTVFVCGRLPEDAAYTGRSGWGSVDNDCSGNLLLHTNRKNGSGANLLVECWGGSTVYSNSGDYAQVYHLARSLLPEDSILNFRYYTQEFETFFETLAQFVQQEQPIFALREFMEGLATTILYIVAATPLLWCFSWSASGKTVDTQNCV